MVASLQKNDVTRYQVTRRNRDMMPIPQDARLGRGQFFQGGQGLLGALFLNDPQNGIQDNNCHDGRRVNPFTEKG